MGLSNCIIWVIYSVIIKNYFVFCANFLGVILLFGYCLTAISLLSKNYSADNASAVTHLERTLMTMITAYVIIALVVGIVLSGGDNDSVIENIVGIVALIVSIFYYAAPCSTLLKSIKTKDASSMLLPLICANLANATLWFFYGLIGLADPYIYIPNVLGIVFATASLIVKLTFPIPLQISQKLIVAADENGKIAQGSVHSFDGVKNSSVSTHPLH